MEQKNLLIAVGLAGGLFILGQYVASQPQRIEQEVAANREITVSASAEVSAIPDVAILNLTVSTSVQKTADVALDNLARTFDNVLGAVKSSGVKEDDIKTTNLSISPRYNFNEGQQELLGFEASETIRIKVRQLDKTGEVLAAATAQGVNQAGGISFEIDEPKALQLEAQTKAIAKAEENAKELAKSLGENLGRVKAFSSSSSGSPTTVFARAELALEDVGGPGAPEVNPGTQEISAQVTVTYELK